MIIDFHTHAFPDYLAPRAMDRLVGLGEGGLINCHDGTIAGLIKNMDAWNIDYSVLASIATNPKQNLTVNDWSASIQNERIIPFGSFYPDEDYKKHIDYIVSLGLKGIKLHPEYQNFHLLDPMLLKSYEYILSKGLILLFHAGEDGGTKPPYKSSPKEFAQLADMFNGEKVVLAHLGSLNLWEDVYTHLAGKDFYFDTSMGFQYYSNEIFIKIVKKHGAHKILFASDSPWSRANEEINSLNATDLSKEEKENILGKNAVKLLQL